MRNIYKILGLLFILIAISIGNLSFAANQEEEIYFLAETLWGEARGERVVGMEVVANTIMNRQKYYQKRSSGKEITVKDVVLAYKQYSYWNDKNWNLDYIKSLGQKRSKSEAWRQCMDVATRAVTGMLRDNTGGAMHYYATWMDDKGVTPAWARNVQGTTVIGHHRVVRGVAMAPLINKDRSKLASGGGSVEGGGSGGYGGGSSSGKITDLGFQVSYTPSVCTAPTASASSFDSVPRGYGIYSDGIAGKMSGMLKQIYNAVGQIYMLGHGIMCYAQHAGAIKVSLLGMTLFKLPHFGYLGVGLVIYITAFFISLTIGMFFIDVSFKLGFAVLYFPIAVALWPFSPTKNKIHEVFGIILHNAMLYALTSIGVGYALVLINTGVIGDTGNWVNFWNSINKEASEVMAENFSLGSVRIVVIVFCLVFGYKIIESSIRDYLNAFFSDGVMGGMSPMHHLGTQALHFAKAHTVDVAVDWAKDTLTSVAGTALGAGGEMFTEMSKGNYGGLKKIVSSVYHPSRTAKNAANKARNAYNRKMASMGEIANDAIHNLGDAANAALRKADSITDAAASKFMSYDKYKDFQNKRDEMLNKAENAISGASDSVGNALEQGIAHGGGAIKEAATPYVEAAKEAGKKGLSTAIAGGANALGMNTTSDNVRQNMHKAKEAVKGASQAFAAGKEYIGDMAETAANAVDDYTRTDSKTLRPRSILPVVGKITSAPAKILMNAGEFAVSPVKKTMMTYQGAKKTFGAVKKLVKDDILNGVDSSSNKKEAAKIILKNSGSVVVRKVVPSNLVKGMSTDNTLGKNAATLAGNVVQETAKTARGTVEDGFGIVGGFLSGIGNDLKNRPKSGKSGRDNWREYQKQKREEEEEERIQREVNRSFIDPQDNGSNDEGW